MTTAENENTPANTAAPESIPAAPSLARVVEYVFDNDEVDKAVRAKLLDAGGRMDIKGFRRGKAPLSFLLKRFGGEFLRDELINLAAHKFNESQEKPDAEQAAAPPQMDAITTAKQYAVRCNYEIMPDIGAPDFSAQTLMRPVLVVGDAEVDAMIEKMRGESGEYIVVDRPAAGGDMTVVDYVLLEDGKQREKGEDRGWVLNGGLLGEETIKALTGTIAGDNREITLPQPVAEGAAEQEPPKELLLRVSVKSIRELKKAEMNDAFFARYGISEGGETAFRAGVREMLDAQVESRLREVLKQRALDCWMAATPRFSLPKAMVRNEILAMWQDYMAQLRQMQMTAAAAKMNAAQFAPGAARRVALGLLLAAWRKRDNVEIQDEEAEKRLEELSMAYQSPEEIRARTRNNAAEWENLKLAMLEERAVNWICDQVKTEDEQIPMERLLG
ncbi:MAG: trigger factor [Gammaproteobacteria bacterium]